MVQNLNPEFIPKIKASIETLTDQVKPNIVKGVDNIEAMTRATESDKFIKSGEAFAAGTTELLKATDELVEVLQRVEEQYSKVNDALN